VAPHATHRTERNKRTHRVEPRTGHDEAASDVYRGQGTPQRKRIRNDGRKRVTDREQGRAVTMRETKRPPARLPVTGQGGGVEGERSLGHATTSGLTSYYID
jgi:hypothetical protein